MSTEVVAAPHISVVGDDPSWRLQRWLRLIPNDGLGIGRRALFFAMLSWLPVALWAAIDGRLSATSPDDAFLSHFGLHVRCLIAIPLMIVTEGRVHRIMPPMMRHFLSSGAVPPSETARFEAVADGITRLRDWLLPWLIVGAVSVALPFLLPDLANDHELVWARVGDGLGFGGWWCIHVSWPIFIAMLLAWLWRLCLFGLLLFRVARLPLSLVPSHADRNGGLAFIDFLPAMFASLVFALSLLVAAHWSHEVLYHGETLATLRVMMVAFVVLMLLMFLGPLCVFVPPMFRAKWIGELEYGALVGRYGRLLRQRWIRGQDADDVNGMLSAPELGSEADIAALYRGIERMRPLPIGMRGLLTVLGPAGLPLLVVVSLRIPMKELLFSLVKALV